MTRPVRPLGALVTKKAFVPALELEYGDEETRDSYLPNIRFIRIVLSM